MRIGFNDGLGGNGLNRSWLQKCFIKVNWESAEGSDENRPWNVREERTIERIPLAYYGYDPSSESNRSK